MKQEMQRNKLKMYEKEAAKSFKAPAPQVWMYERGGGREGRDVRVVVEGQGVVPHLRKRGRTSISALVLPYNDI